MTEVATITTTPSAEAVEKSKPAAGPIEIDIARPPWPFSMIAGVQSVTAYGRRWRTIESSVDQYARSLGEEAAVVSERSPVEGRFYLYGGHVIGWSGLALAVAGLAQISRPDHYELLFGAFGIGILMILASTPLIRRGREILNPTAAEYASADRRRPVLMLASFRNKDTEIVADAEAQGVVRPTAAADTIGIPFRRFGPFRALPPSDGDTPVEGRFGQVRLDSLAGRQMEGAFLVMAVPAAGPAVSSEIASLARGQHGHKLLVLMPPLDGIWPWDGTVEDANDEELKRRRLELEAALNWRPKSGTAAAWIRTKQRLRSRNETEEALRQQRWTTMREALRAVPGFQELPADAPPRVIAVHVNREGRPIVLNGPKVPTGRDYLRAITLAVYGMKCHARN